jgi:hypothetical protein
MAVVRMTQGLTSSNDSSTLLDTVFLMAVVRMTQGLTTGCNLTHNLKVIGTSFLGRCKSHYSMIALRKIYNSC